MLIYKNKIIIWIIISGNNEKLIIRRFWVHLIIIITYNKEIYILYFPTFLHPKTYPNFSLITIRISIKVQSIILNPFQNWHSIACPVTGCSAHRLVVADCATPITVHITSKLSVEKHFLNLTPTYQHIHPSEQTCFWGNSSSLSHMRSDTKTRLLGAAKNTRKYCRNSSSNEHWMGGKMWCGLRLNVDLSY